MKVLVDTSVWSLALRRKGAPVSREAPELAELIREMRALIIGPIRQELLSGMNDEKAYERLREGLRAFDDVPLDTGHYELAASLYNRCRARGIHGSSVDLLICAVALRENCSIFTVDADFTRYRDLLDIKLHAVRGELK